MIFISAGHNLKGVGKQDPGAVNKDGIQENNITIEFRDLVCRELDRRGAKYIKDRNDEPLANYLSRIKTGNGSVVIEFHCDASNNSTATGSTAIVGNDADRLDRLFAKKINDAVSTTLGIKNRGVITESESHRGRLGLMREQGIVCLQELFFISNPNDLAAYRNNKFALAYKIADIIIEFEGLVK